MNFDTYDDVDLDAGPDRGPRDPASLVTIVSRDDLPDAMTEIGGIQRSVRFFAPRPYSADGYEGAAFRNGNGDFFEMRSYGDGLKGKCLVFSSLAIASEEQKVAAFKALMHLAAATGLKNMLFVSSFAEDRLKEPDQAYKGYAGSLMDLDLLFDLILREAGRALPGVVTKDQVQSIIEAEWPFLKGDLRMNERDKVAGWLSSYEMIFDMFPSGCLRRTISFDGARRITLREKGVEYLRERAFLP
ncbi:hypothetical protein G6L37_00605 [Agrobacterium rubi]|nr:hypothetical protein [Agrobacterium rubi]NTF23890.1 hypothetical protein [Agrobacterium rubi]